MLKNVQITYYAFAIVVAGFLLSPIRADAQTDGSIFKSMNECLEAKVQGQSCEPVFRIVDDVPMTDAVRNLDINSTQRPQLSNQNNRDRRSLRRLRSRAQSRQGQARAMRRGNIQQPPPVSIQDTPAPDQRVDIQPEQNQSIALNDQHGEGIHEATSSKPSQAIELPVFSCDDSKCGWSSWTDPYNWKDTPFIPSTTGGPLSPSHQPKPMWKAVYESSGITTRNNSECASGLLSAVSNHKECICGKPWWQSSDNRTLPDKCIFIHHPSPEAERCLTLSLQDRKDASKYRDCYERYYDGLVAMGFLPPSTFTSNHTLNYP